jgi:hypothetical protein
MCSEDWGNWTLLDVLKHERVNRADPLRRFISTPYAKNLHCMGRCIRLETNSRPVVEHVGKLLEVYPSSGSRAPQFCWRIISEPLPPDIPLSLARFGFGHGHLRYADFGQRNFLAVDLLSRLAITYVSDELVRDAASLTYPFLDTLFCMCAATLGFTSLFANCIDVNGKGILLMGDPGCGKTTLSYLAAGAGMRLQADDGVFLEFDNHLLKAWGGFWPVVFRDEALRFLPEIRTLSNSFIYDHVVLHRVEKSRFQTADTSAVRPHCCLFLSGETSDVRIVELSSQHLRDRLSEKILFEEDESFQSDQDLVLTELAKLPAYELCHGGNPALALPLMEQVIHRLF